MTPAVKLERLRTRLALLEAAHALVPGPAGLLAIAVARREYLAAVAGGLPSSLEEALC